MSAPSTTPDRPASISADRRPPQTLLLIAAIVTLAAVIRFGALTLIEGPLPTGDERYYAQTAHQIAIGAGHYSPYYRAFAGWPPAQSFVLSLVADPDTPPGRGAQQRFLLLEAALGTGVVLAIALLGMTLFDPRTGLTAGLLAALYPTFVAYSHYLWSETLFLLLITSALAASARVARSGGAGWVVVAGLLFGLATLTREIGGLIAGCVALWWVSTGLPGAAEPSAIPSARRRARRDGLLLLACTAITVAPWTIRNYQIFHRLVPVSTVGWMGAAEGNNLGGESWLRPDLSKLRAFRKEYFAIEGEMARVELARARTIALVAQEQPAWLPKKWIRSSAQLFSPDTFLFKKISRGTYGALPAWLVRCLLVVAVGSYLAVMVAALLGIAWAKLPGQRLLSLSIAGVVIGLHTLTLAGSRYRLPLMPLAMIYASHAFWATNGLRRWPGLSRGEGLAVATALVMLVVWPCVYFAPDAMSLWRLGTYLEPTRP